MSFIHRKNTDGYFTTREFKRPRNLASIPMRNKGTRLQRYARRPEVEGVGLLYHVKLNRDGTSLGFSTIHTLINTSGTTIIRVPADTVVRIYAVSHFAELQSHAWSSDFVPFKLRYSISAGAENLINQTRSLLQGCELPQNRWDVIHPLQVFELKNKQVNFTLDYEDAPTSRNSCEPSKWRAEFYIRIIDVLDEGNITINTDAFTGIESVSKVNEIIFPGPQPPKPPVIGSVVTRRKSGEIKTSCTPLSYYNQKYNWYLDGEFEKETTSEKVTFTGLVDLQEYSITVKVVDELGVESDFSDAVIATPSAPGVPGPGWFDQDNQSAVGVIANAPVNMRSMAAVWNPDTEKFYVIGPYNGISYQNEIRSFDPSTGKWELVSSTIQSPDDCSMTSIAVKDNVLYFGFGFYSDGNLMTYNLDTGVFNVAYVDGAVEIPPKRVAGGAYDAENSEFYAFGERADSEHQNKCDKISNIGGIPAFTTLANFPVNNALRKANMVVHDGKIYIGLNVSTDFWEYDIEGDLFTQIASVPNGRIIEYIWVYNGDIFALHMDNFVNPAVGYLYKYTISTNSWEEIESGFSHNYWAGAYAVKNSGKELWCFGGYDGDGGNTIDTVRLKILS